MTIDWQTLPVRADYARTVWYVTRESTPKTNATGNPLVGISPGTLAAVIHPDNVEFLRKELAKSGLLLSPAM